MPFELMGTSVNSANTFAVLKASGGRLFTVHVGDRIDGYTFVGITSDRLNVRSPDNEPLVIVAPDRPAGAPMVVDAGRPVGSNVRKITENLNTDQSIPASVTLGPTGFDPNNGRQMGH